MYGTINLTIQNPGRVLGCGGRDVKLWKNTENMFEEFHQEKALLT